MSTFRLPRRNTERDANVDSRVFNLERNRPATPVEGVRFRERFSMADVYVSESGEAEFDEAARLYWCRARLRDDGSGDVDYEVLLDGATVLVAETITTTPVETTLNYQVEPGQVLTVAVTAVTGTPVGFVVDVYGVTT